jgi:hypothetical protein
LLFLKRREGKHSKKALFLRISKNEYVIGLENVELCKLLKREKSGGIGA